MLLDVFIALFIISYYPVLHPKYFVNIFNNNLNNIFCDIYLYI